MKPEGHPGRGQLKQRRHPSWGIRSTGSIPPGVSEAGEAFSQGHMKHKSLPDRGIDRAENNVSGTFAE
jgi:hypothetical protein